MFTPLYLFTVHVLYNHCILIRYSYYIAVTYVHIVVSYYFFFISDHELITISFHSIEQFSCRQLYKVILYVSWHGSVIFTHIYTYMLVHIHFWYTYYICTVYLLDTGMTFLSTIFVCLYLYILHSNGGFDWHMYIPLYIYLLHIYHIIITYLKDAVITLFLLMLISLFFIIFFISDHELITISVYNIE